MLLDDYRAGKRREVWQRLRELGEGVRTPDVLPDAMSVARETMSRVRHNVELLVERIRASGYQFVDDSRAHVPPTNRDLEMIAEIEVKIGPLPLNFRAFHEVVGSVNFTQSRDQLVHWGDKRRPTATEIEILGEEDPLFVGPVARLYEDIVVTEGGSKRRGHHARYNWRKGGENRWYYCFAPDEFHKANYSGGENYNLFVPDPCADFRIRDLFLGDSGSEEEDREWFVDNLRNTLNGGGGFRGKYDTARDDCVKRLPGSPLIDHFRDGLLEI